MQRWIENAKKTENMPEIGNHKIRKLYYIR
jgi:hypothetical protein